jgi:hypothetical protein
VKVQRREFIVAPSEAPDYLRGSLALFLFLGINIIYTGREFICFPFSYFHSFPVDFARVLDFPQPQLVIVPVIFYFMGPELGQTPGDVTVLNVCTISGYFFRYLIELVASHQTLYYSVCGK